MRVFKSNKIPHPPFCLCWNLIPKNQPLALEIGAGNGMFSLHFCQENPDWFLFSLERTAEKSNHFKQLKDHSSFHLNNLYFLRADGVNVVAHLIPKNTLNKIFLLYPNPYPKKKQANLRWQNMSFFPELLSRLKIQGEIELRTNLDWYAREFRKKMEGQFGLLTKTSEKLPSSHVPQTAFEKKYLARGEDCFRLLFSKNY